MISQQVQVAWSGAVCNQAEVKKTGKMLFLRAERREIMSLLLGQTIH